MSRAGSVLEKARAVLGNSDDWVSLGGVDFGYGLIAVQEGRFYQAIEHFAGAIEWYRKCAAPKRLALALENMATVKRFLSLRLTRSIDAKLERRRAARAGRDDAKGIAHGDALQRCEQLRSEAFSELAVAEAINRSVHNDHGLGAVRIVRGFLYLDKGELDCAVVEASEAFELGLRTKNYFVLARCRILQSKIEGAKYEDGIDEGYDPSPHAQRAHDYAQDALEVRKPHQEPEPARGRLHPHRLDDVQRFLQLSGHCRGVLQHSRPVFDALSARSYVGGIS